MENIRPASDFLTKNILGQTNLFVTPLCWGIGPLGNMPESFGYEVSSKVAIEAILKTFKSEVNFSDTARVYGDSERRIGAAIKANGGLPDDFIIATKADRDSHNSFAAEQIRRSVTESCERLNLSQLPLVYLHDPEYHPKYQSNPDAAIKELLGKGGAIEELEKLKEEDVIINIGISGGPIDMLCKFIRSGRFDVVITHNRWNLLWQVADPLIQEAYDMGIGVVNAAVYATGILATGDKEGARAVYDNPSPEVIKKVKLIEAVCQRYDVPMAAAALQFSLRDERINSTVVGIANKEQVKETLRLARVSIPKDIWAELEEIAFKDIDPEKTRKSKPIVR